MKKFMFVLFASATVCTISCKKEGINPEGKTIKKEYVQSVGGDKRPSGAID